MNDANFFGLCAVCVACDGPLYPANVGKLCEHCASRTVEQDSADMAEMTELLAAYGMPMPLG